MRTNTYLVVLAGLACLMWLGGGCAKPAASGGGNEPPRTSAAKPAKQDEQILAEVKKAFAADPELSKEKISISVRDGRVTLEGRVSSGSIRIKAGDTARAVPEVFGVDDERLLVEP